MVGAKQFVRWSLFILLGLAVLAGPLFLSLGGRQASAQAAACWKAGITEQWVDLDLTGSVLRVSVEGKAGLPVFVRTKGGFETSNLTSTKPEYGPFVAEFAPLNRGIYYIEPQGLGIVFEVFLDGKNYTRVDFTSQPCAPKPTNTPRPTVASVQRKPTATRQPAATATPNPPPPVQPPPPQLAAGWRGRVVQHIEGLAGRYFATIAVRVIGRPAGQQVEIKSNGWNAVCSTGTKPEHGPDACEFGSLNAGTYRLSPKDLGAHLDVTVGLQDFVLIEFTYTGPAPRTHWVGSVVESTSGSEPTDHVNSAITVIVAGKPWHDVEIRANGWSTTAQTGHKPEYGPDACEFGGLRAATYTITPKGLDTSAQVTVDGWGWAKVRFDEVPLPAPLPKKPPPQQPSPTSQPTARPTKVSKPPQAPQPSPTTQPQPSPTPAGAGWKGWVISNSSGERKGTGVSSVVIVRVLNWAGVPVTITGGGGWSATCITGTKPEYGPDACEFGGLWPGTYYLQPEGADIQLEVEMDGLGVAFVEFAAP